MGKEFSSPLLSSVLTTVTVLADRPQQNRDSNMKKLTLYITFNFLAQKTYKIARILTVRLIFKNTNRQFTSNRTKYVFNLLYIYFGTIDNDDHPKTFTKKKKKRKNVIRKIQYWHAENMTWYKNWEIWYSFINNNLLSLHKKND